ncbi:MBL fold metallo-hydrolase [Aquipuribacter sp. SD81]|uniref:MBL fold metallo-hydrolase n=1 Tax=Aquipuribacter sp. SD81 TaxID=3127703 RepID=UPI003015936B
MRVTSLGHSCLLVETGGARVLLDPGAFSPDVPGSLARLLGDAPLDAVLVTHAHPDHCDADAVRTLVGQHDGLRVLAEQGAHDALAQAGVTADLLAVGDRVDLDGLALEAVGGQHAVIHDDVPRIGNVGVLLRGDGTTVFHPGDSYGTTPDGVDVLAVPLNAPWAAVKETVEFVRAVAPRVALPVHDALLREDRREVYLGHVRRLGGADVHDPVTDGPWEG